MVRITERKGGWTREIEVDRQTARQTDRLTDGWVDGKVVRAKEREMGGVERGR